jgi:hypothetical protein
VCIISIIVSIIVSNCVYYCDTYLGVYALVGHLYESVVRLVHLRCNLIQLCVLCIM